MIKDALRHCHASKDRFVEDLSRLVRIPSISFPGFPAGEMTRSAEAVAALLKRAGLENIRPLKLPSTHPYVYADWLHAEGMPTVLLYAHHDVQPPGKEELWKSPAFTPTKRAGRLYGRGTADDKAGICMHAAAVESYLKTAGQLPVNVKVLIEGEEETGSENLGALLSKHAKMLSADCIVIADTSNFDTGMPSITTSLRGLVAMDVTVRTAHHSLHSGMWGGPLPDPVQALAKMIATLTDSQGRITVPGIYKQVRPLSSLERRSFAALDYTETEFRKQAGVLQGVSLVGGKSSPAVKLWREPALSVNAIQASSKDSLSNIVNESAWCHVGIRTVPDMEAKKTAKLLMNHLRRVAPWGVKVEFGEPMAADWWLTDPSDPVFQAAQKALTAGYGQSANFIGTGGSIGFIEPFAKSLGGAPAVLIGVEDPLSNPHSENESLHLGDFQKGIRSAVHLLNELAAPRPGA